jgi:hypothetical protein
VTNALNAAPLMTLSLAALLAAVTARAASPG